MNTNKGFSGEKLLEKAKNSLFQLNLKESLDLAERAIKKNDKLTEAYRFLSHLYFYFEKDYLRANELINKAIEISPNEFQSHKIKGDIYYDEKKYNLAIESYEKALEKRTSLDSGLLVQIGNCYLSINDKKSSKKYYESAINEDPLCIKAIRKLRVLCVDNGEYKRAFELWKMDNVIDDEKEVEGTIALDVKAIHSALEGIENDSITCNTLMHLGNSYYGAALYEDAVIVYKKALKLDPSCSNISDKVKVVEAYMSILKEFKKTSVEIYNSIIHGEKREVKKHKQMIYSTLLKLDAYYDEIKKLPRKVNKKSFKKISKFYLKEFKLYIADFFGKQLYGTYTSYIVNKQNFNIKYWSKQGKLQCIELGRDIDGNYTNWAWQYFNAGTGGWVSGKEKNTVYYVSDMYKSIIKYWNAFTDEGESQIWSKKSSEDLSYDKNAVDEVFYSEGLNYRLKYKFMTDIYNEAIRKFNSEKEQREYFVKRYYRISKQISIIAHEGQHAIDLSSFLSKVKVGIYALLKGIKGISSALEYKAKLTELYYGETPYSPLASCMGRDINSSSSHGKANTRIFKEIVRYIKSNPNDFTQIDVTQNILLQIDKLDINQIRKIAKKAFSHN